MNHYYPLPDPDWTEQDPDELRERYHKAVRELKMHLRNLKELRQVHGDKLKVDKWFALDMQKLQHRITQMQMTAHFWSIDLDDEKENKHE